MREFHIIKDRLSQRLQGWKGKLLSHAGKTILIQAVAQAVPLFAMSYFKFPKAFFP